ncbi:MAG: hypothetical protein ACKO1N_04425 [Erythrobacter sp.]
MKRMIALAALTSLGLPFPAFAQDTIVVTGSRQDRSSANAYFSSNGPPAIGVTRQADYFVTPLWVSSDSRDPDLRTEELFAMLAATLDRAQADGIDLVAGNYGLKPVTRANMRALRMEGGNRPDTTRVQIYARIPLRGENPSVRSTAERIAAFVKSIPTTGRSFIDIGGTGLAIENPEQYRDSVVRHIAQEATKYANMFGPGYGVDVNGLDGNLYWQQASETEVFLYIEHSFSVSPK